MSEELRNNIIGNVVGGLILAVILGICGYLYLPARLLAKNAFEASTEFFGSKFTLPVWAVCLLSMGWFLFLVRKRSVLKPKELEVAVLLPAALESENKQQPNSQPPQLNDLEMKIISVLAAADGAKLTIPQIASQISTNNLRVSQALELLSSKDLVRYGQNYLYGNFYFLSSNGRDLAIQHEFA